MSTITIHKKLIKPVEPYLPSAMYFVPIDNTEPAHKAWRLNITDNTGGSYVELTDIDFQEDTVTGTAFSDGFYGADTPDRAFDDPVNSTTYRKNGSSAIVGKVFDSNVSCKTLSIKSAADNGYHPKDFTLEYSDNTTDGLDGHWSVALTVTGATFPGTNIVTGFPVSLYDNSLSIYTTDEEGVELYEYPDVNNIDTIVNAALQDQGHVLQFADYASMLALESSFSDRAILRILDGNDAPNPVNGNILYIYDKDTTTFNVYSGSVYGANIDVSEW